jgi:PAS domain S-box-containing protein
MERVIMEYSLAHNTMDCEELITYANHKTIESTGYSHDELIGTEAVVITVVR